MSRAQRWLITGVSSGIGEALAETVLDRGNTVVGCARNKADAVRFESRAPGRAVGVQLDVSKPEQVRAVVARVIADGPLDVVVSNAGQSIFGAFEETSLEETKALFDVNVFGPWVLAQAVLPHFRERGAGQLVHVSSGCGLVGMAGLSAYCASKFALEGFTEALAQETAQFGVKLLIVEPGAVATRLLSHGTREAARRLPEYGFLSGQGKAALEVFYATYSTPPKQVADAIVTAVGDPAHPLRLLVGEDLRGMVRAKAEQILQLAGS